jgi:hypothetical protein
MASMALTLPSQVLISRRVARRDNSKSADIGADYKVEEAAEKLRSLELLLTHRLEATGHWRLDRTSLNLASYSPAHGLIPRFVCVGLARTKNREGHGPPAAELLSQNAIHDAPKTFRSM